MSVKIFPIDYFSDSSSDDDKQEFRIPLPSQIIHDNNYYETSSNDTEYDENIDYKVVGQRRKSTIQANLSSFLKRISGTTKTHISLPIHVNTSQNTSQNTSISIKNKPVTVFILTLLTTIGIIICV